LKCFLLIFWLSMVFIVISPFSSLILLIWVFSLLLFVSFAKYLSVLVIFLKNHLYVSLILCTVFLFSAWLISAHIFIISLSASLGFSLFLFF
jgi:hypothetical protein